MNVRMLGSSVKTASVTFVINFAYGITKTNIPRTCRVGFGDEKTYNYQDTPGMAPCEESTIMKDTKGIYQLRMKRTKSVWAVQHSKTTMLKGWRGTCDIKLLLYFSDLSTWHRWDWRCMQICCGLQRKAQPLKSTGEICNSRFDNKVRFIPNSFTICKRNLPKCVF